MFFSMKSLKLTKTFMWGCIATSFCIHSKSTKDIFFMHLTLPFTIPNLGFFFCYNDFHSFIDFKERYQTLNFTCGHCLLYNVFDIITYWTFFGHVSCNNGVTFLF
jgi:hypothetical protein